MKYNKKYYSIRSRYQLKRHSDIWKSRKKERLRQFNQERQAIASRRQAEYRKPDAPSNFSFIDNTDKVIAYLNECKKAFKQGLNVTFDIAEVESLTPDAIGVLVACIKDENFSGKQHYRGNEPKNPHLQKLLRASGFYNFVNTSETYRREIDNRNNLIHKETDYKVRPHIAKALCKHGLDYLGMKDRRFEPLYEIIIEAMQNTNNHSSPDQSSAKWWAYVYNENNISKYTFLDLGVGIFDSIIVKNYIKKAARTLGVSNNVLFVKDLLEGKIQTRMDKDQDIRGKGLPQIVENASLDCFNTFYIICNDVKIDIKNKQGYALRNNFSGTFIYWELQNKF